MKKPTAAEKGGLTLSAQRYFTRLQREACQVMLAVAKQRALVLSFGDRKLADDTITAMEQEMNTLYPGRP